MAIRPRGAIEAVIGAHGRVAQRQAGEAQKLLVDVRATAARPWWRKLLGRPAVLGVAVALLLAGREARGQALETGNEFLPICALVGRTGTIAELGGETAFRLGACIGVLKGLLYVGEDLSPEDRVCFPAGATMTQTARVVVSYMERNPAALHRPFEELALKALREAWPCRR